MARRRLSGLVLAVVLAAAWFGLVWWGLIILSDPVDHYPYGSTYEQAVPNERSGR